MLVQSCIKTFFNYKCYCCEQRKQLMKKRQINKNYFGGVRREGGLSYVLLPAALQQLMQPDTFLRNKCLGFRVLGSRV